MPEAKIEITTEGNKCSSSMLGTADDIYLMLAYALAGFSQSSAANCGHNLLNCSAKVTAIALKIISHRSERGKLGPVSEVSIPQEVFEAMKQKGAEKDGGGEDEGKE